LGAVRRAPAETLTEIHPRVVEKAADGLSTATATVDVRYTDGRNLTGQHKYTLLVQGGELVLDSDYKVG
jgi:hypothetical protein